MERQETNSNKQFETQRNQIKIYEMDWEDVEEYRMKRMSSEYSCKRNSGGVRGDI